MEISSAPSIVGVAEHTVTDLRGGKVVFFHLPPIARGQDWEAELVAAISRRRGEGVNTVFLDQADARPEQSFQRELNDSATSLEEALEGSLISRRAAVLSVAFDKEPSQPWIKLFGRVERLYEKCSEQGSLRPLIVFCHGQRIPVTKNSPAVKHRYLWNALRWEDMRGLAIAWLESESTNPLIRAWQISSYTGAANGDPFLLKEICAEAPRQLAGLRSGFFGSLQKDGQCLPHDMELPRTENRWNVPEAYWQRWERGELVGMTLDRGPQIPWESIAPSAARKYEERLIWQEQVTSLLPTLLEFTRHVGQWISANVTNEWERLVEEDGNQYTAIEPGKILWIFGKHRLPRMPDGLYRLLHALKEARNHLAHMKPLDAGDVLTVWNEFCSCQERFGR